MRCVCVRARVCILFTCALCRAACWGHTWEGGTLLRLHSLCQARWLLSLREEVERWKEKWKEGNSQQCQSGPSPEPPHLETTCSWLTPLPLSSSLSLLHTLTFSFCFSRWGRWQWCVWTDLCPYFTNFSMSLLWAEWEEQEGVNEGWRDRRRRRWWWCESVAKYHFILCLHQSPRVVGFVFVIFLLFFYSPLQVKRQTENVHFSSLHCCCN